MDEKIYADCSSTEMNHQDAGGGNDRARSRKNGDRDSKARGIAEKRYISISNSSTNPSECVSGRVTPLRADGLMPLHGPATRWTWNGKLGCLGGFLLGLVGRDAHLAIMRGFLYTKLLTKRSQF